MQTITAIWAKRAQWLQLALVAAVGIIAFQLARPNLMRVNPSALNGTRITKYESSAPAPLTDRKMAMAGPRAFIDKSQAGAAIGGGGGGAAGLRSDPRKITRTGVMELVVNSPAETVDRVAQIAQQLGGYVVASQVSGIKEQQSGSVTVRVPATRFDEARRELKKLAATVEGERTESSDVTMQWADNEARLRNYRAEEARYLEIMKQSTRVKDTLEVAEQLTDVRGRIETLQAEMRTLSQQVETTAITLTLRTEPQPVAGTSWRPLYWLRSAFNDGVDALAGYATAMLAIIMYIPAILAWGVTILLGIKLGWIILKRVATALGLVRKAEVQPAA